MNIAYGFDREDTIDSFRMNWHHFFGHASTLKVLIEALSNSIIDRLDIFSSAIDLENTLVVLFSGEKPHIDSFEAVCCELSVSIQDLV